MSSGWQDAVAGLQSQIDTINTHVSSLSGQEATDSSNIISLQSAVSALQSEVLSLEPPPPPAIIGDLSGQLATLFPGTTGVDAQDRTPVSLSSGGFATIPATVSSIDKKIVRIKIAGVIHFAGNSGVQAGIGISVGDPTQLGNNNVDNFVGAITGTRRTYQPTSVSVDVPMDIDILFLWDGSASTMYANLTPAPPETNLSVGLHALGISGAADDSGTGGGTLPQQDVVAGRFWTTQPTFPFFVYGIFTGSQSPLNSISISQFQVGFYI